MTLALTLRARVAPTPDLVDALVASARALDPHVTVDRPAPDASGAATISLAFHPAAEPVRLELGPEQLVLDAGTGTAGPGYHAFVCEVADAMASQLDARGGRWKTTLDPALYFEHRDFAALERAHLAWLSETARTIVTLADGGATGFAIGLPDGLEVLHRGLVATPLGPRSRAWVERVAADPTAGRDAFAWWSRARDASYHRGIALAAMWLEVRWRKPLDAKERALLDRVATELELAHAADPEGAHPWREWSEVLGHLGEESLRATRAEVRANATPPSAVPIGYRRQPVRVTLAGGWSIVVPGEFAERWDERGTWVAWDATRSLWINTAEAPEGFTTEQTIAGLPELEGDSEVLAMERGPIRGAVRFGTHAPTSDGDAPSASQHLGHAHAALGRHLVVGTFIATREDERETFLDVWGSLDHPDGAAGPSEARIEA